MTNTYSWHTSISCGQNHALVLSKEKHVYSLVSSKIKHLKWFDDKRIISVSTSFNLQCGVLTEDGLVYIWTAYNNPSRKTKLKPLNICDKVEGGKKERKEEVKNIKVTCLAIGGVLGLGVVDKGVFVWSSNNNFYQLATEKTEHINENTPQRITFFDDKNVCSVSCGYSTGAALTKEGDIYVWGDNGGKRLGIRSLDEMKLAKPTSPSFPLKKNLHFVDIHWGWFHMLALTHDGNVWSWGNNTNGQLGNGTVLDCESTLASVPVKMKLPKREKVISISCWNECSHVVTNKGKLLCCGINSNFLLGKDVIIGKDTQGKVVPIVSVDEENDVHFVDVATGMSFALATTKSGDLYIWGVFNGERYNGPEGLIEFPEKVTIPQTMSLFVKRVIWRRARLMYIAHLDIENCIDNFAGIPIEIVFIIHHFIVLPPYPQIKEEEIKKEEERERKKEEKDYHHKGNVLKNRSKRIKNSINEGNEKDSNSKLRRISNYRMKKKKEKKEKKKRKE